MDEQFIKASVAALDGVIRQHGKRIGGKTTRQLVQLREFLTSLDALRTQIQTAEECDANADAIALNLVKLLHIPLQE